MDFMMYRIMLACAGGFSTSMLVTSMRKAAKKKGLEAVIDAKPESDLEPGMEADWDIILLGPQIGHMEDSLQKQFKIPVRTINQLDYGMMNGAKVLQDAIELIKAGK
jgi:PTS system cellobiose-specific IIB component